MTDKLTSDQIVESVREDSRIIRLWLDSSELERTIRASVARRDYRDAVRADEIPAWERAFALVLWVQDWSRAMHGRWRDGTLLAAAFDESPPPLGPVLIHAEPVPVTVCPTTDLERPGPEATRDERDRYRAALDAENLGYVHDPGWTNGGISAEGAELLPDDERERQGLPPSPDVRGIAAFERIASEAVPELAWYYSASALELGFSSTHDALVARILRMSTAPMVSGRTPDGPSADQIQAATLQRTVRGRLGQLTPHLQAVLELAYTDRRYDATLVSAYGPGLAPLVWRAAERAGGVSKEGRVSVTPAALDALVADVRREWPTYEGSPEGGSAGLAGRVRRAAECLLWTAHSRYRTAAGLEPTAPRPRRRKRRSPVLVPVSSVGAGKRRLVEVPRQTARAA